MGTIVHLPNYRLQSQAESLLSFDPHMTTSELVYFCGAHFAHIVARDEHLRLERIRTDHRKAFERRTGSRARKH